MIFKKFIQVVVIAFMHFSIAQAQPFFPVGGGTNNAISSLFADSVNTILYAGGQFSQAGGIQSNCIAKWNGIVWDSTRNQFPSPPLDQVRTIEKFNNEIYVGGILGVLDTLGNQIGFGIAKWNSSINAWDSFGTYTYGSVFSIYANNNQLYVSGNFDSIGGIYSSKIARYDGTNWYGFPTLDAVGGGYAIDDALFYNGELYVGGNFDSQLANNMKDIAKWDGTQWLPVSNGLSGAFTWVNCFAMYQGKLIVGGYFHTSAGDPGNGVVAWDGTQWSQLGTGVQPGQVFAMQVYNNELYVGGGIYDAGGIPVSYLAKWDGTQWHSLNVTLDNVVTSFAVLGNDLYIGGAFWTMNGDSVNRIIRYNYLTGFETLLPERDKIFITPNPAADYVNITGNDAAQLKNITLYNALGTPVKIFNNAGNKIYVGNLNAGLYLIRLPDNSGTIQTGRFIISK